MQQKQFERKHREEQPVVAICYDFDKTLTPDDMQAQGFIQAVNCDVERFWRESNELSERGNVDQNLAYMLCMKEKARGEILFKRDTLREYGAKIALFPGVEDWFERIRAYGREKGVIVEHYIISSGLLEMIEGTSVARQGAFEAIYASSFYYDEKGVAIWPAQVVNYTNKTQFLFRIEKGVLDVNDPAVNDSFPPEEIRVPFTNFIYVGDSDTDVPCMRLVNSYGGSSIGVYDRDKVKVYKMIREGRIKYFEQADYREGTRMDELVKGIIDQTAIRHRLDSAHFACKRETEQFDRANTQEGRERIDLMIDLENSGSFAATHTIIAKMAALSGWEGEEVQKLCAIARNNAQVEGVLRDKDVRAFFIKLLKGRKQLTPHEQAVQQIVAFDD